MSKLTAFQKWCKEILPVVQAAADGEEVQFYGEHTEEWIAKATGSLRADTKYRIKPRTITVNGFEVPEPMRIKPDEGFEYFVSTPSDSEMFYVATWDDDIHDERWFYRGLCHTTEEAAIAHAKAMLGIDPNQPEE